MGLEWISIALVAAGVFFILVEVFIPGGIVGSFGALLLGAGVVTGFLVSPGFGMLLLIASVVAGFFAFWLWLKFFPKSPIGRRVILSSDMGEWHSFDRKKSELLGKTGIAHTLLRPSGTAVIDGSRIDVVSRGEMIPASTRIRVVEVAGNRVVVDEFKEESTDITKAVEEMK